MTTEQILSQTREQIRKIQSQGIRNQYPQNIKDSIVTLGVDMPAPKLAKKLEVSLTFIYKCLRQSKKKKTKGLKVRKDLLQVNQIPDQANIKLQDITHEIKSFMKEDNLTLTPSMRLTTNSGIIVEIF